MLKFFRQLGLPRKKKVLIVEDDPLIEPILQQILQSTRFNCEVKWLTKVEDALIELQKENFQLVISDYFLTGSLNGVDLYHHCRTHMPKTSFVLMTTLTPETISKLTLGTGPLPYFIQKPFYLEKCKALISELLV